MLTMRMTMQKKRRVEQGQQQFNSFFELINIYPFLTYMNATIVKAGRVLTGRRKRGRLTGCCASNARTSRILRFPSSLIRADRITLDGVKGG
jgi:hypothetical protein